MYLVLVVVGMKECTYSMCNLLYVYVCVYSDTSIDTSIQTTFVESKLDIVMIYCLPQIVPFLIAGRISCSYVGMSM